MHKFKFHSGFAAAAALALVAALAQAAMAQDAVVLASGRRVSNVTVLRDNFDGVAVDRNRNGEVDEVFDPEEVSAVEYGDTPASYRQAELALRAGRLEQAAEQLKRALAERDAQAFWLVQHGNYRLGETLRRLGEGDAEQLAEARRAYRVVLAEAPLGRMVPRSIRGVGLTHLVEGDARSAEAEFRKLAEDERYGKAWNLRGNLLLARAKGELGQAEEGLALCDAANAEAAAAGWAEIVSDAARTRAEVLLAAGQFDRAYAEFMDIARGADEQDAKTLAVAYTGVGDALIAQGQPREALLAYLRVRVLYFQAEEELPRALYGAARGFTMLREGSKAREIVELLRTEYPRSIWTARAVEEIGG